MKKLLSVLLIVLLVASFAFANGDKEQATGKKKITIGAESWEINKIFLEQARDNFMKAHPDVEVEIVTIADQTKLSNYILDWAKGSTDVDLVFLDGGIFATEYAAKNLIYDFDKDLNFFKDFPKSNFTAGSLATGVQYGKQFCLPAIYEVYGVSVNTKMCKEAGVDYKAIRTWDDFYKATEKLTKKDANGTVTQVGGTIQFGNNLKTILEAAVYSEFGSSFAKDGISINVDNAYVKHMVELWQKGIQNGYLSKATFTDNAGGRTGFKSGQIALCYEAAGRWMEAKDTVGIDNLALIPIPGNFGGTLCFGCQMVIPKASKNADVVCQFIKEGVYGEYSQTNAFNKYGKMSVIQKYFDKALEETPMWKGIKDSMAKAVPLTKYQEDQKYLEGLNQIFQAGLVDPKTSSDKMVKQIVDLLASIKK